MKRIIIIFAFCMIKSISYAYDFEYNGLYYVITSVSELSVNLCAPPDNVDYPDNLVIPSTIEYNGKILFVRGLTYGGLSTCKNLKSITIPSTMTSICDNAFDGCTSLTKVIFEDGNDEIKLGHGIEYKIDWDHKGYRGLFFNCPLVYAYIGRNFVFNDYNYFGYNGTNYAPFQSISSLKEVYLGEKCESVGARYFEYCIGLESVHFSSNIRTIERYAFQGCNSLKSLDLPKSLTFIGFSAFRGLNNLKKIIIPQKVTKIESYSFGDCPNLKNITFMGKTDLDDLAFGHENEPSANVYVYSQEPSKIKESSFTHNTYLQNLYVPSGTKELYAAATGWKEFWNIIETGETPQNQCATPTIRYENGLLIIESTTPSSKCYYSLSCSDNTNFKPVTSEIELSAEYIINAYATAEGYIQSETVTAKLYWIEGNVSEKSSIDNVQSRGVIVTEDNGLICVSGLEENELVSYYSIDGKLLGRLYSSNGFAQFYTSSSCIIVKIGQSSLKIQTNH